MLNVPSVIEREMTSHLDVAELRNKIIDITFGNRLRTEFSHLVAVSKTDCLILLVSLSDCDNKSLGHFRCNIYFYLVFSVQNFLIFKL